MSIGNINNQNTLVQGMTENESLGATNLTTESKANDVKESGNLGLSGASKLPSPGEMVRIMAQTHPEPNTNLTGAAQPGKGGFFSAIKHFFTGLFSKATPELKLPEKVTVMVAGQPVAVRGERMRGMIEALPKSERGEAIINLTKTLTNRLADAETLLSDILAGNPKPNASVQDAADLMLFIQLRHEALNPKESFTNGAYSIEDPDGKLAHFLDSCKAGYNRTSSHLKDLQSAELGNGEKNAMRGIDIPGGDRTGLLDKRGTIHYGSIPKQEGVEGSTRRLFIKTERNGCRVSLRSFKFWTKSFWVNTSGRPHRFAHLSDIGSAIKHGLNFLEKSEAKSGINYRSEKLKGLRPKDVLESLKDIGLSKALEDLQPYFKKDGEHALPKDARLADTLKWLDDVEGIAKKSREQNVTYLEKNMDRFSGASIRDVKASYNQFFMALDAIKSKLIDGMYTNTPNVPRYNDQSFSSFLTPNLQHPDRLGNEVMLKLEDLVPPMNIDNNH